MNFTKFSIDQRRSNLFSRYSLPPKQIRASICNQSVDVIPSMPFDTPKAQNRKKPAAYPIKYASSQLNPTTSIADLLDPSTYDL